jgi:hypothetical protein
MVEFPLINSSNYTQILQYGINEYTAFIPLDIFVSVIISVIAIGIFLSSDGNLKAVFGFLMLTSVFFGAILSSLVLFAYCIIAALIGAYMLYTSYFEG